MSINGSCFCGEITYHINGKLRDARSCHCSMCRKAFNAQASAYALIDKNALQWKSGKHLLTHYKSKQGAGLMFCSKCGSTLCGSYQNDITGVTLGCVEGDPDIEIGMHIFVGSKATWEVIPAGTPQYDEWPPDDKITQNKSEQS